MMLLNILSCSLYRINKPGPSEVIFWVYILKLLVITVRCWVHFYRWAFRKNFPFVFSSTDTIFSQRGHTALKYVLCGHLFLFNAGWHVNVNYILRKLVISLYCFRIDGTVHIALGRAQGGNNSLLYLEP